ncbi:GAF and ANTAR domain-containing protein [Streptomyces sp. NPDC050264]|uniref:GAF and ANTAR domain-containing protein n=1 Tax=Streptomyces sp. NPDC050264 TaxID=3155038 RepID=UPI00343692FC
MTLQEQELAAVFAHLTEEAARDPLDTQALLATLVEGGRRLFDALGAIAYYAPGGGSAVQTAGTDDALRVLAGEAVDWQEGPGYDVRTTGCALIDVDVTIQPTRARWPRWTARVRALGHGRVTALPLPAKDGPAGALVLFGPHSGRLDEKALSLARSFADAAANTLSLQREVTESRVLAGQLEHALSSRVVVEQAKGILAARHDVTLDQAFDRLRRYARSHQRKVQEVAREIIGGRDFPMDP